MKIKRASSGECKSCCGVLLIFVGLFTAVIYIGIVFIILGAILLSTDNEL